MSRHYRTELNRKNKKLGSSVDHQEQPRSATSDDLRSGRSSSADDLSSWQLKPQVGKRIPGDLGLDESSNLDGSRSSGPSSAEARYVEAALQTVQSDNDKMMLVRQQRAGRMYDVPQIECPNSPDHTERFACPRPDRRGRFRCIDDRSLCDGFYDCPNKEDESPEHCLFYKMTKAHLDILAEALLRWARGR